MRLLVVVLAVLLSGCRGAQDEDADAGPVAPLRHAVVPVEPGTPVVYLVSLVGVPQGESALASNKVVPELAPQNSLTNLLLLASRNTFVDNPDLVLRDPPASNLQGDQLSRKKRSPSFKNFGGGGCGGFPCGGRGGYGGGGYGGGRHGGGYGGYGGGGYGGCNTCGGGGGYGNGGSYSQSSSSSSSSSYGRGKK